MSALPPWPKLPPWEPPFPPDTWEPPGAPGTEGVLLLTAPDSPSIPPTYHLVQVRRLVIINALKNCYSSTIRCVSYRKKITITSTSAGTTTTTCYDKPGFQVSQDSADISSSCSCFFTPFKPILSTPIIRVTTPNINVQCLTCGDRQRSLYPASKPSLNCRSTGSIYENFSDSIRNNPYRK